VKAKHDNSKLVSIHQHVTHSLESAGLVCVLVDEQVSSPVKSNVIPVLGGAFNFVVEFRLLLLLAPLAVVEPNRTPCNGGVLEEGDARSQSYSAFEVKVILWSWYLVMALGESVQVFQR